MITLSISGVIAAFGFFLLGSSGFTVTCCAITDWVFPLNGGFPTMSLYKRMPTAYTSTLASRPRPRICSGAMYAGVPMTVPT